jgi:hypothetical protein
MAEATEKLTDFEDRLIEFFTRVQESVVDGLRTVADKLEGRLPEVKVPYADKVPTADEVVDNTYSFAGKVLDNQKDFADNVLKATAPVRDKFVTDSKPATKKAPAKKATAKAA